MIQSQRVDESFSEQGVGLQEGGESTCILLVDPGLKSHGSRQLTPARKEDDLSAADLEEVHHIVAGLHARSDLGERRECLVPATQFGLPFRDAHAKRFDIPSAAEGRGKLQAPREHVQLRLGASDGQHGAPEVEEQKRCGFPEAERSRLGDDVLELRQADQVPVLQMPVGKKRLRRHRRDTDLIGNSYRPRASVVPFFEILPEADVVLACESGQRLDELLGRAVDLERCNDVLNGRGRLAPVKRLESVQAHESPHVCAHVTARSQAWDRLIQKCPRLLEPHRQRAALSQTR